MSMGSSWQRFSRPDPPERGSFPLDLAGECRDDVKRFIACIKSAKGDNERCKPLARVYLKCRMDHGLMTKDDFTNLGFSDTDDPPPPLAATTTPSTSSSASKSSSKSPLASSASSQPPPPPPSPSPSSAK
ncbi:hypothetical protein HDU88_001659 [Geranomyces variabilis]|nr:hypothetical protein HDU88_001659 [Geranomyces variabilis]